MLDRSGIGDDGAVEGGIVGSRMGRVVVGNPRDHRVPLAQSLIDLAGAEPLAGPEDPPSQLIGGAGDGRVVGAVTAPVDLRSVDIPDEGGKGVGVGLAVDRAQGRDVVLPWRYARLGQRQ